MDRVSARNVPAQLESQPQLREVLREVFPRRYHRHPFFTRSREEQRRIQETIRFDRKTAQRIRAFRQSCQELSA